MKELDTNVCLLRSSDYINLPKLHCQNYIVKITL